MINDDEYQIKGKALVYNEEILDCYITIKNERILRISKKEESNLKTIKFSDDYLILPSPIDLHVHFRDWAQSYKETIKTGSLAALSGGVTTVIDMPNTIPPIQDITLLNKRIEDFYEKSYVDFGIHVKPLKFEEINQALNKAVGIKFYEEDLKLLPYYKDKIYDKNVVVHAQFGDDEVSAVDYVLNVCSNFNSLRFAHISKKDSIKKIRNFKKHFYIEVTPHHMFLSKKDLEGKPKGYYTVRPPLGNREDNLEILNGINSGIIDFIATDHAPHTLEEKLSEDPPPGFASIEILLPLCITHIYNGNLNLIKTIKCLSENPANYLKIKKGIIKEGYYADITIIDIKNNFKIDSSKFISQSKFSPFEGKEVKGKVKYVILRGKFVYDEESLNFIKTNVKNIFEL